MSNFAQQFLRINVVSDKFTLKLFYVLEISLVCEASFSCLTLKRLGFVKFFFFFFFFLILKTGDVFQGELIDNIILTL